MHTILQLPCESLSPHPSWGTTRFRLHQCFPRISPTKIKAQEYPVSQVPFSWRPSLSSERQFSRRLFDIGVISRYGVAFAGRFVCWRLLRKFCNFSGSLSICEGSWRWMWRFNWWINTVFVTKCDSCECALKVRIFMTSWRNTLLPRKGSEYWRLRLMVFCAHHFVVCFTFACFGNTVVRFATLGCCVLGVGRVVHFVNRWACVKYFAFIVFFAYCDD